jgi:ubiquinone/menaquinone biosynthesis C-methylase UbiE
MNMSRGFPPGAGKSSFDLIDATKLFEALPLSKGSVFLDMGCGKGEYTFAAAEILGNEGVAYALDLWEEGIAFLQTQASAEGKSNIKAMVADVGRPLPIESHRVDLCLMATVLHDLVQIGAAENALREAARILKPQGVLAVVEFNKVDGPPGPPVHIRLSPEEVEEMAAPHGFKKTKTLAVGPYNYLMLFSAVEKSETRSDQLFGRNT